MRFAAVKKIRAAGGSTVPSRIDEERATNPMLRTHSPSLIANVRAQAPSADLSSPLAVFTATRKLKDSGAYRQK
jgi:hypothetical protein